MQQVALIIVIFLYRFLNVLPCSSQSLPLLLEAIRKNEIKEVVSLLNKGASISVVDDDSDNVLMYAALYSSADCMKLLLKEGADPNAKNKLGETALMWCSHDMEKTRLLLENHADINIKANTGNTAFLIACVGAEQKEMIKLMLDYGADPLVKNNNGFTSLMFVSQFGDTADARLLLNKSVSINEKNTDLETALFLAIRSTNKEMTGWLLANGADANSKDIYKAVPLSYAVVLNDIDIVNSLLTKTTAINDQDIDGMTLLMWATYNEHDNPAIIQALLDKGAALNLKDKNGETALTWALKKGNTATAALLKRAGAQ